MMSSTSVPPLIVPENIKRETRKLRLVSVSRVSPSREGQAPASHRREHTQNEWTVRRHGFRTVSKLSFVESALSTERGAGILAQCELESAAGIVVPHLRRLGVGLAQVQLTETIETAGLVVLSGKDSEETILRSEQGHLRAAELLKIAADDYLDWAKSVAKWSGKGKRISPYWYSPDGEAVIAFVEERRDAIENGTLSMAKLAKILNAQGYRTPTGKQFYTQSVKRAFEVAEALRNTRIAALRAVGE